MTKQTRDALTALVAVLAAAASVYFAFVGRSPKVDLDTYYVLGAVTAEETAKLLQGKGRILVLARGTGDAANPSVETELAAFRDTIKKHGGLSIAVEKIEIAPMQIMATGGGIPVDELMKAIRNHSDLSAVVLFFGLPPLVDSELEALQNCGVKIVLVSSFQPGVDRLLERRAIHLAIVPKPDTTSPDAQPAKSLRERFDREYAVLSPAGEDSSR